MADPIRGGDAPGRRNQYFVPGEGIAREVITADICKYLDNDATVRPGEYNGRQGYFVYAYRNLTTEMMEDLKADSRRWQQERQERARQTSRGGSDRYVDSTVHQQRQMSGPSHGNQADYNPPGGPRGPDYRQPAMYGAGEYNAPVSQNPYPPNPRNEGYSGNYVPDPGPPARPGGTMSGPAYVEPRTATGGPYYDDQYQYGDPQYQYGDPQYPAYVNPAGQQYSQNQRPPPPGFAQPVPPRDPRYDQPYPDARTGTDPRGNVRPDTREPPPRQSQRVDPRDSRYPSDRSGRGKR